MAFATDLKSSIRSIVRRATTVPYFGRAVQITTGIWRIPDTRRTVFELADKLIAHQNMLTQHTNKLGEHDGKLAAHDGQLEAHETKLIEHDGNVPDHENLVQSVPVSLRSLTNRLEFVRRELMFEMRHGARATHLGEESPQVQARVISGEKLEMARKNKLKLNLGCGHIPLVEFINIDRRELPDVDVIADLTALPFEKGEVDEIFSAHVLEHFPQEQLRRQLLPYWKSLLKPGGVFRAVVPDAECMIKEYCNNNFPYAHLREVTFGSQDYDGDFHFNMFSRDQLTELLVEAGFLNVQFEASGRRNGICFEMAVMATN